MTKVAICRKEDVPSGQKSVANNMAEDELNLAVFERI